MSNHPGVDSEKFFEKIQLTSEDRESLHQSPAERITNLTRGRPLIVGPVIDEKVQKFLMTLFRKGAQISYRIASTTTIFYSAEG